MSSSIPAIISSLCGTLVLTLVYWYLYSQYRERYMRIWATGWTVYSARFIFEIFMYLQPDTALLLAGHQMTNLLSGYLLLWGTYQFVNKPLARWWIYCFILVSAWVVVGISYSLPVNVLCLPTFLFVGLIFGWTGAVYLGAREIAGFGKYFAGWAFIIWGVHKANYPFLRDLEGFSTWGYMVSALLESAVACGTLLAYFQKIRQDLGSSERRFRLMAENARDIIYRYRMKPVKRFEYVSPSSVAITGYTPRDYYENPDLIAKLINPADRISLKSLVSSSHEDQEPVRVRIIRDDGREIFTEHRIVPIFEEGVVVGFEGIARDITERKQAEDALRESYQRFREMLENVRLLTMTLDEKGHIIFCNKYLLELTGWPHDQLFGRDWFEVMVPADRRDQLRREYLDKIKNNNPVYERFENQVQAVNGNTHTIRWNTILLRDADGRAVGTSAIGEDITERKNSEEILKRYQLLSQHARDIMLFLTRSGEVLEANDAALQAYGYTREEMLTKNLYDLRAPEEFASIKAKLAEAEERSILYETLHRRSDGAVFPVEVTLQSAYIGNDQILLAILRDITERKRAEETINHLAYHDPLTDLPNRILFYDRLTVAMATARRNGHMLAVMFLDLDRFKYVNDMMGHVVGDQLLTEVARHLSKCVRRNDTVARIGGDEFTLLLPQIHHEEDAAKVARNLIETLKKPWVVNNSEVQITASIGIALFPNDGEDAETLTTNADTAMYRAKEVGDNYQFYNSSMNIKAIERVAMEQALKKAVEAGEFIVHYQPQVNIETGCIVGVEALVRWQHPEKGMIFPEKFISLAEDTGLIIPIGELVLRTACKQAQVWQTEGYGHLRLAVNLSACQFRQKNLVENIAQVLQETGLDPSLLELEITESTAMQDMDFSINILNRLRAMGIGIAIDDFGTGYSSLNYLRRFPITSLKIDRSFVRDVLTDVSDAAIVATIIVLAQNMRLKVVVEGVETKEQMAFFAQQECFDMQGYLFSEPVSADEIAVFMRKARQVSSGFSSKIHKFP